MGSRVVNPAVATDPRAKVTGHGRKDPLVAGTALPLEEFLQAVREPRRGFHWRDLTLDVWVCRGCPEEVCATRHVEAAVFPPSGWAWADVDQETTLCPSCVAAYRDYVATILREVAAEAVTLAARSLPTAYVATLPEEVRRRVEEGMGSPALPPEWADARWEKSQEGG